MKLTNNSALDLTLKGSVGSFKIGASHGKKSLEVKYLLTHVGLNFEEGSDEKLLTHLAPVREVFDFRSLDFDEIMQRDIDDSRVSGELIPYLLDEDNKDLVKFFPPIVVMLLPVQNDRNKPADFYPELFAGTVEKKEHSSGVEKWYETRTGGIGKEVFKFEQPVIGDEPEQHDLVSLSINSAKSRMIIVDGQHRAMALLALYRNLKDDWSNSRRKPFESYYQEWTPDYINRFNLGKVKLPMIICTVPELDSSYEASDGSYDLKKASRSIFLTLNKNARKVSRSRNLLLDDTDLVSSFMRDVLSKIKNGDKNFVADKSLEIHNVELDQAGDRQSISSPMSFTGVSHLYYIVEHLLLDSGDINGIRKREGRFSTRSTGDYFNNALARLDCENKLGIDAFNSISRNIFSRNDEQVLSKVFMERYGKFIISGLTCFEPYEVFARSTQHIKNQCDKHADVHIKPMLFDGQGIAKVFEEHRRSLKHKLDEGFFKHEVPKIESFKASLDATNENYDKAINDFKVKLTLEYLDSLPKAMYRTSNQGVPKPYPEAVSFTSRMFDQFFNVIAFQAALVCCFYNEYEKVSSAFSGAIDLDLDSSFEEYIEQVSEFFMPKTESRLKKLIELFYGSVSEFKTFDGFKVLENANTTFRQVVFPGEMAPDEWPKYRYLILEIWNPSNQDMEDLVETERNICRKQVMKSLYNRNVKIYCRDKKVFEDDLTDTDKSDVFSKSKDTFKEMLKNIRKASVLDSLAISDVLS
jgi:hypothetical protein